MAGKLSPVGLSSLLSWLASASGPAVVQLLARQGVVAGVVAALRPQHLQALQVLAGLRNHRSATSRACRGASCLHLGATDKLCHQVRSHRKADSGLLAYVLSMLAAIVQMWPETCGGGTVAVHAVLVYSATLLNAPWIQTAAAMQATQTALAADLLHCDVVGAFTAGAPRRKWQAADRFGGQNALADAAGLRSWSMALLHR